MLEILGAKDRYERKDGGLIAIIITKESPSSIKLEQPNESARSTPARAAVTSPLLISKEVSFFCESRKRTAAVTAKSFLVATSKSNVSVPGCRWRLPKRLAER